MHYAGNRFNPAERQTAELLREAVISSLTEQAYLRVFPDQRVTDWTDRPPSDAWKAPSFAETVLHKPQSQIFAAVCRSDPATLLSSGVFAVI